MMLRELEKMMTAANWKHHFKSLEQNEARDVFNLFTYPSPPVFSIYLEFFEKARSYLKKMCGIRI